VHGKGLEPLRLAAAEPKADRPIEETRETEETRTIGDPREPETRASDPVPGQSWGNHDAVEAALAKALEGATAAGRFDVVALLAGELQARRLAREGVPNLNARKRRGGA
jgi:hypothetical protein